MKKLIMTAVAAGTLVVAGTASAQDVASDIINGILSLAGVTTSGQQMYADQFGRQFYYDQYGRQVYVQTNPYYNNYNNNNVIAYDQWGRPVYGSSRYPSYSYTYPSTTYPSYSYTYPSYGTYAYSGRSWDYDGDGVSNSRDRYPNDPRYR